MNAICTEYGFVPAGTVETKVERPPRPADHKRRFVITIPEHLAEDFGISGNQVPAETYVIHCKRRWVPGLVPGSDG